VTATDQYGLALSTDSAAAAEAYIEGLELTQSGRSDAAARFSLALEHDDRFAMARAGLAFLLQGNADPAASVGLALFATNHAQSATRREQQHVEVMRLVAIRDLSAAAALASTHLAEYPSDALVLWQLTRLLGVSGDADRKAKAAAELDQRAPVFGDDPWFLGLHSFALSESLRLDEAEQVAERGLTIAPGHVLPAHSRAHVAYERHDDAGGRQFLRAWLRANPGALVYGHMLWHLALTELALGDADAALACYRDHDALRQMADAASLLWRLHLRGLDVLEEMQALVDTPLPAGLNATFIQAHQAALFCALGDGAALDHLLHDHREDGRPAGRVFAPWVTALRSIVGGRWAEAVAPLETVCADVRAFSGSNEQHDLFHETLAAARRRLPA
jgi:tetratricopeptide (TPR) repeat protein